MLTLIKQWLAPPIFEGDEEKTLRASLLNAGAYSILLLSFLEFFGDLVGGKTPPGTLLIDVLGMVLGLSLRHWLRRGKVDFAGTMLLALGFALITGAIISLGTIRTPTTTVYLLLVVMAGVMFEWRGVTITTLAGSLAVLGLILAEQAGMLPQPDYTVTISQWITYTVLFGITGGLFIFTQQTIRRALARAEKEISKRKSVEMELRKLTRAVEQSPASIVITDLSGNIEYVNPRFTQITGYGLNEVAGRNPRMLKTNLTRPGTHAEMWGTLSAGKEWHGEFVNRKKDGSIYYESASISPITDLSGTITHYLAVKEDISERRKNEIALRTSEARFRSLFEQNHDGVFILGLDGRTLDANQRAADMLGYTLEEIRQGKDRSFFDANNPSENSFARLLAGEHVPLIERIFRKKDGQGFPVEINIELVCEKDGQPLHVQSIVRDITERKQAEEKLRQQNEYLSVLHQITLDLLNRRDMDELLQAIVDRAVMLLDAPFGELMLEKNGELIVQTYTQNQQFLKGDRVGRSESKLSWLAFDTKMPAVLEDYSSYPYRRNTYSESELHAAADFPVLVRDKCIGILAVGRSQPGYVFSQMEIDNGMLFAQLVALVLDSAQLFSAAEHEIAERRQMEDALRKANEKLQINLTEIKNLQEELREQAIRDPLTGLYNRRYLNETIEREIARASRANNQLSVIVSDVDGFKMINDTYGHQVGDLFLAEIAGLLKKYARRSDIVCRYGGEEFLLLLPGTNSESARKRSEEIRQKCAEIIIQHEEKGLRTTVSFGVATYPIHGQKAEEIIIKADKALYQSKRMGRNCVTIWNESIR